MLADRKRTTIFIATVLLIVVSVAAAKHAQRASAQTVLGAGNTEIVDANGNGVGKLFETSTR